LPEGDDHPGFGGKRILRQENRSDEVHGKLPYSKTREQLFRGKRGRKKVSKWRG